MPSRSSSRSKLRLALITVSPLGINVATTFSESSQDWAGVKGSLVKPTRSPLKVLAVKRSWRACSRQRLMVPCTNLRLLVVVRSSSWVGRTAPKLLTAPGVLSWAGKP